MSQVDYASLSDQELKHYFLRHRQDKAALQAYLDRLSEQPREVITTVDDPDFEIKIQAAILRQMRPDSTLIQSQEKKVLSEVSATIQNLLEHLEHTRPTATDGEK